MAGVVKGVQQVVSSCPAETSVCVTPKSNQCGAFNTDSQPVVDNFSFVDVNNKDLLAFNPPTSDDTSLQDLIDSELALRISSNTLEHDDVPQLDSSSPRSPSPDLDSAGFAAPKPVVNGNIITDFLDQERSHTESASSVSSPAAPLCSGDDFDDLLGSEPADSDFSPNIPDADAVVDAKNDNADEATLAEDISFASDKSQERAERGSLLDLDPLQPDSPEEQCEPQPEGLERRRTETEEVGEKEQPAEQPERQSPETRPLFQGGEESAQAEPVPDALDVLASAADAEPEPETEPECGHSETEARQDPDDEYAGRLDLEAPDPNYPSGVNDSMDVFASAVPGPPAPNPVTPAGGAVFEDGFETWSTVEEAVVESGLLDAVVPHSADPDPDPEPEPVTEPVESDTETVSETTEKKVSKKKKMEGTDSTSTKKKTKKNKKSDAEKENISVLTNGNGINGHSNNELSHVNGLSPSNGYADHIIVEDDLSNVCVKELKSAYTTLTKYEAFKEPTKDLKDIDHDIIYCGPIHNLKQTYCSEASVRYNGTKTPDRKERIATGISIRDLRRSFGDLRNCENAENGVLFSPEEEITNEAKARSLGDLRRLSRDLYRPANDTNAPCLRKPIHTGVSVKALKSSFSKFDQLSKKTVLHVRSVDASKVQKQFNESASTTPESQSNCKSCGKQVFVMEQIKAEKAVWHKNCFRCKECSKQLTVDTYSSNEGELYCKPHFRELFKPKAVVDETPEPMRRRKPELIIRENQPMELPPEVVRASDKPDLGLEELSSLNVKSRFQVFEKTDEKNLDVERSSSTVNVKRSPSILSKLAKFQAKGMDIGVTDDSLNGIPYEESSTSSEEESEEGEGDEENGDIVKSSRKTRERPMSFSKMEDVKSRWETGSAARKEERREERKQEIQSIRSRLFMGKQGKMKEMYEQAVKESEQPAARKGAEVRSEKAKSIKEKFERGETLVSDEEGDEHDTKKIREDDIGVFEAGISKKSRSLFMELDATAAKTGPVSPAKPTTPREEKKREVLVNRQVSNEVVKASDKVEDLQVETAAIASKFKFFESYREPEKEKRAFRITPPREGQVKMESPEREIYRDPEVVRAEDRAEEDELQHSMTTSKMLSLFRQMEEKAQREDVPDGPKPLKCFTPPPDCTQESGTSEEESSEEEESEEEDEMDHANDGIIRSSDKPEDEFLKAAKEAAKAKTLRAKFEHWEEQENNINNGGGNINPTLLESEHESIESTKSLRARFESLRHEAEAPKEKPRPKVNRFVEIQTSCAEFCDSCQKKVYPLEKVETGGKLFHKGCFRCVQCSCVLRMESYTLNNGKLYCIPHYKQLFISKGNYDEGFGLDQHKRKWKSSMRDNGDILLSGIDANGNSH